MRAVFLDSGGVITRLLVPKPDVFIEACHQSGIELLKESAWAAFRNADSLLDAQQELLLSDYPRFRTEYMDTLRRDTGLDERLDDVYEDYLTLLQSPHVRDLYEDALPAITVVKDAGLKLGVLSNASRELISLLLQLGVAPYLDAIIVSQLVGYEKPQREIFTHALEALDASPEETVHVGDSYHHDYLGASRSGLRAFLLDRSGSSRVGIPKLRSLRDLPSALNL